MKPILRIATALGLLACVAAPLGAAARQADPYDQLKSYDFQDRTGVAAINKMIQESLSDKAQTAQIEQHIIAVLEDPACTVGGKREACRMLWIIGSEKSVPVLAKMLSDESTADMARYALERNTDPSAGRVLRSALATTHGKSLVGVINSIGDRRDSEGVDLLKPLASASDPLVAEAAVTALGKIGTEKALTALRGLPSDNLRSQEAILRCAERLASSGRKAAAQAVYESLAGEGHPTIARADALCGLAAMKSSLAPSLALADLRSSDTYLQVVAARICGSAAQTAHEALSVWSSLPTEAEAVLLTAMTERDDTFAADVALKAMESDDPVLRTAGIRASARLAGVKAIPRLLEVALHGQGDERHYAQDNLAGMRGQAADNELLSLARTGPSDARVVLASVLAQRGTPASRATLLTSASGSDASVAVASLKGLGDIGGAGEYGQLVKLVVSTQDDEVRDAARDSVVAIGQHLSDRDAAADPLVAALPGAQTAGKTALLQALAGIGGDKALATLTASTTASEADVKQAAVTALGENWSDSRPVDTLLKIAKSDSDKVVRVEAIRGYLRLVGQDDKMSPTDKVAKVALGLDAAERPEEKRQAISILRICRVQESVELASKQLDTPDLFSDAADTIIYLAGKRRKDNRDLAAVTGDATKAALSKVIQMTKDDDQRARAQQVNQ